MSGTTKEEMRRAARISIKCPHCSGPTRIGDSKTHDVLLRQIYFACLNVECGHTFSADLMITHTISPSATPNPGIKLRTVPPRQRHELVDVPAPANELEPVAANDDQRGPEVPRTASTG